VRSRDAAGNTSEIREYTVIYDPQAPELDVSLQGLPTNSASRRVSWEASSYSDIAQTTLTAKHRVGNQTIQKTFSAYTQEYVLSELNSGAWDVTMRTRDKAGNVRTKTETFEIAYSPHQFAFEDDTSARSDEEANTSDPSEQPTEEDNQENGVSQEEEPSSREQTTSASEPAQASTNDSGDSAENSPAHDGEIVYRGEGASSTESEATVPTSLRARLFDTLSGPYAWSIGGGLLVLLIIGAFWRRFGK